MNVPMTQVNFRQQFDAAHGSDCILVDDMHLYSDGARMGRSSLGEMLDPPTDPTHLGRLRLRYWEENLRRITNDFKDLKNNLEAAASWNPTQPMPQGQLDILKKLQADVRRARKKYNLVRKEVESKMPADARYRERALAATRRENEQFVNELQNIKI